MNTNWLCGIFTATFLMAGLVTGAQALPPTHTDTKVSIRVVDDDGTTPLAGFNVTMTDNTAATSSTVPTDSDGRVEFHVSLQASISVNVEGQAPYAGLTFNRQLGEKATFAIAVLILKPRLVGRSQVAQWRTGYNDPNQEGGNHLVRFAFHCKYYRDHAACPGVTVAISSTENPGDAAANQTLTTDADGTAVALIPDLEHYQVAVTDPNGVFQPYNTVLHPGQYATSRQVVLLLRK